ncbi:MAG: hypothetical protein EOM21_16890 [Gammaproteobacteria bacterium]|nr:hypothetical protein [Gammaproteobacteria bacterium]
MSTHYEPHYYPAPAYPVRSPQSQAAPDCAALMRLATTGAIVAGSAAAAQQIRRFQSGAQTPQGALVETTRTAVIGGVATAAAGAIASSVSDQGFGRLGLMFLIGTAVVYGIQSRMTGSEDAS